MVRSNEDYWITVGRINCPDSDCDEGRVRVISQSGKSYSEQCGCCEGRGYLIKYRNTRTGDEVEY